MYEKTITTNSYGHVRFRHDYSNARLLPVPGTQYNQRSVDGIPRGENVFVWLGLVE
jgi:hypothetical protein